jgi:hypothetical protein
MFKGLLPDRNIGSRFVPAWKLLKVIAAAVTDVHANVAASFKDAMPDSAWGAALDRWIAIFRPGGTKTRKAATPARKASAGRVAGPGRCDRGRRPAHPPRERLLFQVNSAATIPVAPAPPFVDVLAISTGSGDPPEEGRDSRVPVDARADPDQDRAPEGSRRRRVRHRAGWRRPQPAACRAGRAELGRQPERPRRLGALAARGGAGVRVPQPRGHRHRGRRRTPHRHRYRADPEQCRGRRAARAAADARTGPARRQRWRTPRAHGDRRQRRRREPRERRDHDDARRLAAVRVRLGRHDAARGAELERRHAHAAVRRDAAAHDAGRASRVPEGRRRELAGWRARRHRGTRRDRQRDLADRAEEQRRHRRRAGGDRRRLRRRATDRRRPQRDRRPPQRRRADGHRAVLACVHVCRPCGGRRRAAGLPRPGQWCSRRRREHRRRERVDRVRLPGPHADDLLRPVPRDRMGERRQRHGDGSSRYNQTPRRRAIRDADWRVLRACDLRAAPGGSREYGHATRAHRSPADRDRRGGRAQDAATAAGAGDHPDIPGAIGFVTVGV